jgi:hypothetical protein
VQTTGREQTHEWPCPYCRSGNALDADVCSSCGAQLRDPDDDLFGPLDTTIAGGPAAATSSHAAPPAVAPPVAAPPPPAPFAPEPERQPEPEPRVQSEVEPEVQPEPEPEPRVQSEVEPEVQPEPEPRVQSEVEPEPETEPEPEPDHEQHPPDRDPGHASEPCVDGADQLPASRQVVDARVVEEGPARGLVLATRLAPELRRAVALPLSVVGTLMVDDERVRAVVAGTALSQAAVLVLTDRRVMVVNGRVDGPVIDVFDLRSRPQVRCRHDGEVAAVTVFDGAHLVTVDGIADIEGAVELARAIHALR